MRDPKRIERICRLLAQKWHKVPDQRLGQFLENYVFGHKKGVRLFYQEDDVSEEMLKDVYFD